MAGDIRWRDQDKQEIRKVVNSFNQKIRYWEKKGLPGLPDKVSVSELQELITTRKDFNRELNRLRRFGKRGAQETVKLDSGLQITKWEKQEIGRTKSIVNQKRARLQKELGELEATSQGKPLGLRRGEMGSARMNSYKPRTNDINKIRDRKELRKLRDSLLFEASNSWVSVKAARAQLNYLKGLAVNFTPERVRTLMDHIAALPPQKFLEVFMSDQQAEIEFLYSYLEQVEKFHILMDVWQLPDNQRDQATAEFEERPLVEDLPDWYDSFIDENYFEESQDFD